MKIKQTVKIVTAALVLMAGLLSVVTPITASAVVNKSCGVETAIIDCSNVDTTQKGIENTGIWSLLLTAINILTGLVGLAAVAGVVYGSVLYTSAGGSAEQVKKAMGIITNVVIGVIAYALMFAGLNFLVPGGLFT